MTAAQAPRGVGGASSATAGSDGGPGALLLAALVLGAFVGMVDATVVAVALDPMTRHFHVSLAAGQSVLGVYLVTVTATLPTLGRLGDRFGRRRAYCAGFAVFGAGSVVAALAPSFAWLLAGRAVQAVGGGLLTAGSLALIAQHAPRRRTGRSVALLVVAQAVAGLAGPPLGGLLVWLWGWQAVFWAGLPAAALGAAVALRVVPPSPDRHPVGVDLPGAAGLAALLLGLGAGIGAAGGSALGGWPVWAWMAVAAAGAATLLAVEPRVAHPLLDRRLLRQPRFAAASVASFLSTGTLMSCFALLPYWLEDAHHVSAGVAGAAFLPIAVGIGAASRRGGRQGDAGRTRAVTLLGMVVAAAGFLIAALAAALRVWPLLPVGLLVLGAGNGLFSSPNTSAAIGVAPRSALGGAAGFLSTARNAGVIVGLGATGAVYTALARGGAASRADAAAAVVFGAAAAVCLVVGLIAHRAYAPVDAAAAVPVAPSPGL